MGKETLIAINRELGTEAHDVIAAIGVVIQVKVAVWL